MGVGFGALGPAAASAVAVPAFHPTRFTVEVEGRGPDVILIPGLGSGRHVWAGLVRALPGYRYHLIQVAGFAGSPVGGNRSGAVVSPLAAELARYIAANRLVRPAIVGHSMGGTLAMMIGVRNPGLAGRIMAVDMLPQPSGLFGATSAGMNPLADRLRGVLATPGGRQVLGSLLSAFSPPAADERRSDPNLVGRVMHDLARVDLGPHLARITAPLTIVYAAPDARGAGPVTRTFTAAYARAPRTRLVRIEGAGHMVMLDQPARFAQAVREFMAG